MSCQPKHNPENYPSHRSKPAILDKLEHVCSSPETNGRPRRCRAIIFSPDGSEILGIKRIKQNREPYVVFPGGGLEDTDATPEDGIWRELGEELQLGPSQILLTGNGIYHDGEYFFLGWVANKPDVLSISGPEAERQSLDNQYLPGWYPLSQLEGVNMQPTEITQLITHVHLDE